MKVASVVGNRPQFIKLAAVSPILREAAEEVVVHTGQHYDVVMSKVFFQQLRLPAPNYELGVGSGTHGAQTGRMLEAVEEVLIKEKPRWVLVFGDTNSTLAGALAGAKLGIPVAHVESGLRSFNRAMPEEINRVLADHASDLLLAPTKTSFLNLVGEGLQDRAVLTGDVMVDVLSRVCSSMSGDQGSLRGWGVRSGSYVLVTLHRPSNVDDPKRLKTVLMALESIGRPILFPIHPRTSGRIREFGLGSVVSAPPFVCVEPFGYREMVSAERSARAIVTDSGGVQREAYLLRVPCVTLRAETEWVETVEAGWNSLIADDVERLGEEIEREPPQMHPDVFGDGRAAARIVEMLVTNRISQ